MKALTKEQIDIALNLGAVYDFPENIVIVVEMYQDEFDGFQKDTIGEVKFKTEIEYNSKTGVRCKIVNLSMQ